MCSTTEAETTPSRHQTSKVSSPPEAPPPAECEAANQGAGSRSTIRVRDCVSGLLAGKTPPLTAWRLDASGSLPASWLSLPSLRVSRTVLRVRSPLGSRMVAWFWALLAFELHAYGKVTSLGALPVAWSELAITIRAAFPQRPPPHVTSDTWTNKFHGIFRLVSCLCLVLRLEV